MVRRGRRLTGKDPNGRARRVHLDLSTSRVSERAPARFLAAHLGTDAETAIRWRSRQDGRERKLPVRSGHDAALGIVAALDFPLHVLKVARPASSWTSRNEPPAMKSSSPPW